jgi:hypothetical protein
LGEKELSMMFDKWFVKRASMVRSWWSGVWTWWLSDRPVRVEEPPFVPFDLTPIMAGARPSVPPDGVAGPPSMPARLPGVANVAGAPSAPATLAELGVPKELALHLESAFRVMGASADGQVVGYRFRTPDGVSRPIRLDDAA